MDDKTKPLQLLLVVETSSEDKTDAIYINEVIRKYFDVSDVNIQWITLGGKSNYKNKKIRDKIKSLSRMFESYANGKTVTIYFIDTDSTETQYIKGSFFSNLKDYVEENGYELVWFCKNAENVFLRKEPDSLENKTEAAKAFALSGGIDKIPESDLNRLAIELNCSNILLVLSKYLVQK